MSYYHWIRLIEFLLILFAVPTICAAYFMHREFVSIANNEDKDEPFTWYVLLAIRKWSWIKYPIGGAVCALLGGVVIGLIWLFDHFLGVF